MCEQEPARPPQQRGRRNGSFRIEIDEWAGDL
jgi:hypothetical protein